MVRNCTRAEPSAEKGRTLEAGNRDPKIGIRAERRGNAIGSFDAISSAAGSFRKWIWSATSASPQRQRDEAVRTGAIGATAMIYAARALGLGSTPMIGFDAGAVASEFALAADEVPVMLLSVGAARPENWPQKPRRPVADVLEFA